MYSPSRGGHAPGHLRDAFYDWLLECDLTRASLDDSVLVEIGYEETPRTVRWLLGQLWNCTDVVPGVIASEAVDRLEKVYAVEEYEARRLRQGCSCAHLARRFKLALDGT